MNFDQRAAGWDTPERIERTKTLAGFITAELGPAAGLTALEVGCGTGLMAYALEDYFEKIYCVEASAGMLAVLSEKLAQLGTKSLTPCGTELLSRSALFGTIDVVYSSMAFHHIQDIRAELTALRRMLKQGGHLIIIDLDTDDGSFHSDDPDFNGHHGFERPALGALMEACGFGDVTFKTIFSGEKPVGERAVSYSLFLCHARVLGEITMDYFESLKQSLQEAVAYKNNIQPF